MYHIDAKLLKLVEIGLSTLEKFHFKIPYCDTKFWSGRMIFLILMKYVLQMEVRMPNE